MRLARCGLWSRQPHSTTSHGVLPDCRTLHGTAMQHAKKPHTLARWPEVWNMNTKHQPKTPGTLRTCQGVCGYCSTRRPMTLPIHWLVSWAASVAAAGTGPPGRADSSLRGTQPTASCAFLRALMPATGCMPGCLCCSQPQAFLRLVFSALCTTSSDNTRRRHLGRQAASGLTQPLREPHPPVEAPGLAQSCSMRAT